MSLINISAKTNQLTFQLFLIKAIFQRLQSVNHFILNCFLCTQLIDLQDNQNIELHDLQ